MQFSMMFHVKHRKNGLNTDDQLLLGCEDALVGQELTIILVQATQSSQGDIGPRPI
jgi:hypothetical protein